MATYNLHTLFTFIPQTQDEINLFPFDRERINKFLKQLQENQFWLGGQIKMKSDDNITLDTIERVKEINKRRDIEYGGPCNSFEAASIQRSNLDLEMVENMVKQYNEILALRNT